MTVFVSASDESKGKDHRDQFLLAGLIGSERDWSEIFIPAWQGLVLDGRPSIPYLHMTDIRSKLWREELGLSEQDAGKRIDRAVSAIGASDFLFPLGLSVSGAQIRDAFASTKVKIPKQKRTPSLFEPDYLCFLGYVLMALDHVSQKHQDCEKLDFIVEQNGKTTEFIKAFHVDAKNRLTAEGREDLARLVGELIPVGKESSFVQAADVLCRHRARSRNLSSMNKDDRRRCETLRLQRGRFESLGKDTVEKLAELLLRGESTD